VEMRKRTMMKYEQNKEKRTGMENMKKEKKEKTEKERKRNRM
jgi:hypothetical protein